MIPYFVYDHINIGPLVIYTWGFFVGLGFLTGFLLLLYQARQKGIDSSKILNLFIFIFLGGLAGSRLGYILQFPEYYFFHPFEIFEVWAGGLMFYGGLLGALLLGWLYLKLCWRCWSPDLQHIYVGGRDSNIFRILADLIAPAAALGISIGYLGCSLINDHQGAATALPWGILWPDNVLRQPVAQYLSLNSFIIFFVLWFLRNRLKKPGRLFILFLLWYGLSRFLLDFTRATGTYLADPHYLGLTISQWVSLGIVLWIILLAKQSIFGNKKIEAGGDASTIKD